jgi:hypothetical protein
MGWRPDGGGDMGTVGQLDRILAVWNGRRQRRGVRWASIRSSSAHLHVDAKRGGRLPKARGTSQ